MSGNAAGGDISRRRLGGGVLALGGALALASLPLGASAAAAAAGPTARPDSRSGSGSGSGTGSRRTTLRRGTAEQAGLLPGPLRQLVRDAGAFLGPSPTHPWYAGAVLLAGRGGTVALHEPIGQAVRYSAYDEKSDTGVEFPLTSRSRRPLTPSTTWRPSPSSSRPSSRCSRSNGARWS